MSYVDVRGPGPSEADYTVWINTDKGAPFDFVVGGGATKIEALLKAHKDISDALEQVHRLLSVEVAAMGPGAIGKEPDPRD